jgi:uncharacterized membrane protein
VRSAARLRLVLLLATAGAGLSAYLLGVRYRLASAAFCEFGPGFSCEAVGASAYATLFGVPVAAVGLGGFLAIFALQYAAAAGAGGMPVDRAARGTLLLAMAGVVFGAYLTGVQVFVLRTLCVLCVAAFLVGAAILLLVADVGHLRRRGVTGERPR